MSDEYFDRLSADSAENLSEAGTLPGFAAEDGGRVDRYVLQRKLGAGGFGAVYLAEDTEAGIQVALKTLPGQIANSPDELERMRGNFALVQKLAHPNIATLKYLHKVEVVDAAASQALQVLAGDYLLVMEYAPGSTLSAWRALFPGRKVPVEQALQICREIAAALDYAHAEKIVHRDIKPANVMVNGSGEDLRIKVLDFGLAAEIRSSLSRVSKETGDTSGTRPYMSPEQWSGRRQGAAADQYSLAVLFYELVSGAVPFASAFETNDPVVMLNAGTNLIPETLPELSKHQNAVLLRALAKDPSERFASCRDFIAALEGRRRSGSGALRLTAALLLLLALAYGGTYAWRQYQSHQATVAEKARLAAEQAARNAAEQERIASLSKAVRVALSAGNLEEAGAQLAELTELAGADSAAVRELRTSYESLAGERETNARYGKASVERDKAVALDPGQGFAARLETLEIKWREAEAARQGRSWGQALSGYDQVLAECRNLQMLSTARKQAAGAREKASSARQAAAAANAAADAAPHSRSRLRQAQLAAEIRRKSFLSPSQPQSCKATQTRRKGIQFPSQPNFLQSDINMA